MASERRSSPVAARLESDQPPSPGTKNSASPSFGKKVGDIALGILAFVFVIWGTGVGIAAAIFNWQYARTHGFWDWVFFGEIVPTLKALVWPYFLYVHLSGANSLTDEQLEHMSHFRKMMEHHNAAIVLIDAKTNTKQSKGDDEFLLLEQAIVESKLIPQETLAAVHAELPDQVVMFRNGMQSYLDGLKTSSKPGLLNGLAGVPKQKDGIEAMNKFETWLRTHQKEMKK